jgi:nicotinamide-nucleotide amidase
MDVSLSERLFDLLKLKKIKIATAESFTAGRVVASIISNSGASEFVHEGVVCYSNDSKAIRMNIEKSDLMKEGAVSSMTAYRMAAGLLKQGKVDLAISTTGVAGPFGDGSQAPVGLCYIGIGMMDGVHTYKLNLTGSREEITEKAKNTALFLAIKKLKSLRLE